MFHVVYLTYILPDLLPYRGPYYPAMRDNDSALDISELQEFPDPNTVMWEASVSAATLDSWLADGEIYILYYEAVSS